MKKLFAFILLFTSVNSFSQIPGWTNEVSVLAIEVHGDKVFFSVTPYSASCGASNWIKFSGNTEMEKRALSGGMMAMSADYKIIAHGVSCDGSHLEADKYQIKKN